MKQLAVTAIVVTFCLVGPQLGNAQTTAPATVDPLLRQAWEQYADWGHRDRDKVVALFKEYIKKDPQSPFLPEVYLRLGLMYSGNRNIPRGETYDAALTREYLSVAHKLYGKRYSNEAAFAWLTLTATADRENSVEEAMEFYDWNRHLMKEGGAKDVYPIRSIEVCTRYGMPLEYTEAEKALLWKSNYQPDFEKCLQATERDLFNRAGNRPDKLAMLAKAYPGTELEKQALYRIETLRKEESDDLIKAVDQYIDIPASSQSQPSRKPATSALAPASSPPVLPATAQPAEHKGVLWLVLPIGCLALVGVSLTFLIRSRRRRGDHS